MSINKLALWFPLFCHLGQLLFILYVRNLASGWLLLSVTKSTEFLLPGVCVLDPRSPWADSSPSPQPCDWLLPILPFLRSILHTVAWALHPTPSGSPETASGSCPIGPLEPFHELLPLLQLPFLSRLAALPPSPLSFSASGLCSWRAHCLLILFSPFPLFLLLCWVCPSFLWAFLSFRKRCLTWYLSKQAILIQVDKFFGCRQDSIGELCHLLLAWVSGGSNT